MSTTAEQPVETCLAEDRLATVVSRYASIRAFKATDVTVADVLCEIRDGRHREAVEAIRQAIATGDKEGASRLKQRLPAVTFAGCFNGRHRAEDLHFHSGCMVIDFDGLGEGVEAARGKLMGDRFTLALFTSPSGTGLKVLIIVADDAAKHGATFDTARRYYRRQHGLEVDDSGRDVTRLCFLSWDPDLHVNVDAVKFAPPAEPEFESEPPPPEPPPEPKIPARLRKFLERGATEGERNKTCFWLGTQLRDEGFGRASVELHLAMFAARCTPPLSAEEVQSVVRSVFSRPPREPGRRAWSPGTAGANVDPPGEAPPKDLIHAHGEPYFVTMTERGLRYLGANENYWAARHAAAHVELYEPNERLFYRYDPETGLFCELSADLIKQDLAVMLLTAGRQSKVEGLIRDRKDRTLTAMVAHLRGLVEERGAFQQNRRVFVHLANGVLELRESGDFTLHRFSPSYRSRNQSPLAFNASAVCPRFLEELLHPAVTPADAILIQKYAGLCLLRHNLIQRILILDGEAGRGKTQLAVVFQELVGLPNVTQLRTEHLGDRFETYRFLRKTLLVGVDVPADFLNTRGASVLKGLVGGDLHDAEQKGGTGSFQFEGHFNVLVTSNSRLRVRLEGDVGAWRRRLLIVRYEAPPPRKKIPDFGKTLIREEGSGILNWALEGLRALLSDIEAHGDIVLDPDQQGKVDALLSESDSLRHFLSREVVRRNGADLTVSELVEAYAEYCPTQGWVALPITIVHRQLETLALELFQVTQSKSVQRHGSSQRGFRNIGWRDRSRRPNDGAFDAADFG